MLQTSPSFSIFNSSDEVQDEENRPQDPSEEALERTISIGESIETMGSGEFSFTKKNMSLIEEEEEEGEEGVNAIQIESVEVEANNPPSPRMYLATGLGIDASGIVTGVGEGGIAGADLSPPDFDGTCNVEEYYKKMVDEYPCHPLFLSSYAQVLQVSLLDPIRSLLP